MENKKSLGISKWILNVLFYLMAFMAIGYVWWGETRFPSEQQIEVNNSIMLDSEWCQVGVEGSRESVNLPGVLEKGLKGEVSLETNLPQGNLENLYLMTWNRGHKMLVYIDGKLRTTYDTTNTRSFGRYHSYAYVLIPLTGNDGGKNIHIELYGGNERYDEYYLGDQLSLLYLAVKDFAMEIILGIIMVLVGICCFLAAVGYEVVNRRSLRLKYLALGVVMCGMWVLTNSGARQFLFSNTSIVRDAAYMFVNVLPMPFLLFLDHVQNEKYHRFFHIAEGLVFINFIVDMVLFVTRTVEISTTNDISLILIILSGILCVVTTVKDLIQGHIRSYGWVAWGFLGFVIAATVQVVTFVSKRDAVYDGIVLVGGLFWLLACTIIDSIQNLIGLTLEKNAAIQASEAKGAFLANMSHEIRTPINAVLGMDEMILRESDDPKILEYASYIHSSGNTLLSLINNILDFSKIESGKMEISEEKYSLSELLFDQVNLVQNRAKAKNLEVKLEADESLPDGLFGDDVRLRQIMTNLMTNAIKYTDRGFITLKVTGKWEGESFKLMIAVKDTGIGIKEEDMHKLFESFERIDLHHNRGIEGTGLGLSITKQLLELMDSSLHVASVYGEGTTFYFELVQGVTDKSPIGDMKDASAHEMKKLKKYQQSFIAPDASILVVDDNLMNLKVIVNLLKKTKVKVETASGGQEGLDMMQQKHYDLIFMDHLMPQMDGIEALEKAKTLENNQCVDSPIIVLTANAISGAREMYLEKGFVDFLSKPVIPEKLERMLIDYLPEELVELDESVTVES